MDPKEIISTPMKLLLFFLKDECVYEISIPQVYPLSEGFARNQQTREEYVEPPKICLLLIPCETYEKLTKNIPFCMKVFLIKILYSNASY